MAVQSVLLKIYWWCFREFNKCYPIINVRILVNYVPITFQNLQISIKNAKNDEKCQKASGVKHNDEMTAASLKARCKCTMMRKLFAAFDEERGLKTAKCMSNCQRGGKANKMSWSAHSSSQEEGTFLFHAHPICEFSCFVDGKEEVAAKVDEDKNLGAKCLRCDFDRCHCGRRAKPR